MARIMSSSAAEEQFGEVKSGDCKERVDFDLQLGVGKTIDQNIWTVYW